MRSSCGVLVTISMRDLSNLLPPLSLLTHNLYHHGQHRTCSRLPTIVCSSPLFHARSHQRGTQRARGHCRPGHSESGSYLGVFRECDVNLTPRSFQTDRGNVRRKRQYDLLRTLRFFAFGFGMGELTYAAMYGLRAEATVRQAPSSVDRTSSWSATVLCEL